MKRAIVFVLWFFAFWSVGNAIALWLGISDLFGPILGLAVGSLVAIDPRRVIWARPTAPSGTLTAEHR